MAAHISSSRSGASSSSAPPAAQICPIRGIGEDVMDDENDKVSQVVVGVKLGNGIHEFQ